MQNSVEMIFNCGRAAAGFLSQRWLVFDDENPASGLYHTFIAKLSHHSRYVRPTDT
jgi:hypothetical protein